MPGMRLQHVVLPDPLVQAQKDDRLVLFVGAGVSHPAPSNLPLFRGLVERVVCETTGNSSQGSDKGTPDEILDDFATRGVNVRGMVREIVSESTEPNEVHRAVAALASAGRSVRVVTTNYDRHLSACLPDATPLFEPPNLPNGGGFAGVVHLHGSVEQDSDRLVVTKSDFADAYLTRDSPTLRFVHALFASQTVLFMGYSLQDTLMQYILEAAKDHSDLYVLTDIPDKPLWQSLSVKVVEYRSRDDLPAVVDEWAQLVGATLGERNRRVARIVADNTGDSDLAPHDESYLSYVVSDPDLVHLFVEHARGPVWFRWVATLLGTKLFTLSAEFEPTEKELLRWFAAHHNDDDPTATEVLRLIIENGSSLNKTLWFYMAMAPNPRGGTSYDTGNRLMLILADAAPAELDRPMLGLLKECETPRDDDLLLELVDRVFKPKLGSPDPSLALYGQQGGPFQAVGNNPSDDWLRGSAEREFWSQRRHLATDLLTIVDGHLRRVCRVEAIAGNPDPYAGRAAIEAHDQNIALRSTDFWVDAARDLYELLAVDIPETAVGYLHSWASSNWVVLKRLAIHGWTERTDVSANKKIRWITHQDDWLHSEEMHHETMRLVAKTVPEASAPTIRTLIDQVISEFEPRDGQIVYDMVGWIAQHAPSSAVAQTAFEQLQAANPSLEMSDHPDFLWWVGETTIGTVPPYIDETSPEDLADRLTSEPAGMTARLLGTAEDNRPLYSTRHEWRRVLRTVHEATALSPRAGLALLDELAEDPATWPEESSSLATAVLKELVKPSAVEATHQNHRDRIGSVLAKVWNAGIRHWGLAPRPSPDHGWLYEARNRWPGLVAFLLIETEASQRRADPESWKGLPTDAKQILERIIAGDSHPSRLAQVACASHLSLLHRADREWAVLHILPMLNPDNRKHDRAVRCWDAYPYNGGWSAELLDDGLRAHFVAFAPHADSCYPKAQQGYAHMAALLCLGADGNDTDGPPRTLRGFFSFASAATRTRFIHRVTQLLQGVDPQPRAEQWHRWMRPYWQRRLRGLPQHLTSSEASALADWVTLLDDDYPTAVDLVLEHPTSLQQDSLLPTQLLRASTGSGPFVNLLNRYPEATAQLIAHLLKHSNQATAQQQEIAVTSIAAELQARTDHPTFQPVHEQLLRLGWTYAVPNSPSPNTPPESGSQ